MIDCCSRRVAGWAIADHMRTELVTDALNAAAALRGSLAGAIFHADHGSQYTSEDFANLCRVLGVTQSMGGVGSCRQRVGRIVQRDPQTRDYARPCLMAGRGDLPPRGLPLAGSLQHQTKTLSLPSFKPCDLRKDPDTGYAARSLLTTNPVSTTRGQGPSACWPSQRIRSCPQSTPPRSVGALRPRSSSGQRHRPSRRSRRRRHRTFGQQRRPSRRSRESPPPSD